MTTEPIDGEVVSRDLVPVEAPVTLYGTNEPEQIIERATKQANVLAKVIRDQRLFTDIRGRKHVRVEGWTTCGALVGVFAVLVWTHEVDDGWEARVEARTMAGAVVGAAEAQCLRTESMWAGRDDYALRSMAQTRATSKALRQPLGWIVTLAGFDPTPEEEMPRDEVRTIPGGQEMSDVNGASNDSLPMGRKAWEQFDAQCVALGIGLNSVCQIAGVALGRTTSLELQELRSINRAQARLVLEAVKAHVASETA